MNDCLQNTADTSISTADNFLRKYIYFWNPFFKAAVLINTDYLNQQGYLP